MKDVVQVAADASAPSQKLEDDLFLSHAFLNALTASYQGLYVYQTAFEELEPSSENRDAIARTAKALEHINGWWDRFKALDPVLHSWEKPPLKGESGEAWGLLARARQRVATQVDQLAASANLETLLNDRRAIYIRAAADCEAAYARQHFVEGLIAYGRIMDQPDVVARWARHTPSCQQAVNEAHALLSTVQGLKAQFVPETVASVLDRTLVLHVVFAQRLVDITRIFTLLEGKFTYSDVAVEDEEAKAWADRGIPPYLAGQWKAAGMDPDEVYKWSTVGIADPLAVVNFKFRGFEPEDARVWWENGFPGRFAAAWRDAEYSVGEAAGWRSQGILHPSMVEQQTA